jgi:fibronectin type 3 domain-containing protein
MTKLLMRIFMFIAAAVFAASPLFAQEDASKKGIDIVPSGDKIVVLAMFEELDAPGGIALYRATDGAAPQKIFNWPAWMRNPDVLTQEMGAEKFAVFATGFGASSAAELLHKSADDPNINFAIISLIPQYPRLITLFKNTFVFYDTNIQPGAKYVYELRIVNAAGAETPVDAGKLLEATGGDIVTPAIPADFKAEAGDAQALLSWTPNKGAQIGDNDAGYFIQRKESGVDFRAVGYTLTMQGQEQKFADTALVNGTEYTYRVTALNMVGTQSTPTVEIKVIPHDLMPPAPPEAFKAAYDIPTRAVALAWKPNSEKDFSHYDVFRAELGSDEWAKINSAAVTSPAFSHQPEKMDGKTYLYAAVAVDKSGNTSERTPQQVVTLPDEIPPAPPINIKAEYDKKTRQVALTWETSPDADNSIFVIYKGNSAATLEELNTVKNDRLAYADQFVNENTTVFYTVRGRDISGNTSIEQEPVKVIIPDLTAPPALFGLQVSAAAEAAGLKLSWNAPDGADIKGFNIYRAAAAKGPYEKISTATATQYTDAAARPGVEYWYKVSQVDAAGNESPAGTPQSGIITDDQPPATPAGLAAEFKKDGIHLKWQAVADKDIAGYNIYVVDLSRFTEDKVNEQPVKEANFIVEYSNLSHEGNAGVKLTAVDTSGNESEKTALVKPK